MEAFRASDYRYEQAASDLNFIAGKIEDLRHKLITESYDPHYEPKIVAYIGHRQHEALMSIERGNNIEYTKDKKFLGARVVRVIEDSYLHIARG